MPDNEFVIFVDGFEAIEERSIEHDFAEFLSLVPPQMHFILAASRLSPMMQATLYQLGRMSLSIRDLSFTREETSSFLDYVGIPNISEKVLDAVMYWTEGWPQGVVLAAEAVLRGGQPSQNLPYASLMRLSKKYFVEQILTDVPSEEIEALARLSAVEAFNAELVEEIFDDEDATEYVDDAISRNLFIIPSDDVLAGGYRFHRMFAGVLRERLQEMGEEFVRSLSMRACIWFYDKGDQVQAAKYLLLASDFNYIENLAEAICPFSREDKREDGISWLLRTPADTMEESPLLCMMVVWSFVTNARISPALEWIEKFESCARREEYRSQVYAEDIEFATKCLTMKCHAMAGEGEEALAMCDEILGGGYDIKPSLMSMIYQSLGEVYERLGKMHQAQEVYLQGQASASVDATMQQYFFNAFNYAHILFLFGDNDNAILHCRRLLRECPEDFALSGAIGALLARALLEKNEREHVPEIIANSLKKVSPYRHADMYLEAKVAQTRYLISLGQFSEAYETIVEASMQGERRDIPRGVLMSVYCLQAELASRRHNSRDLKVLERKMLPRAKSSDAYGMALMLMTRGFVARESRELEVAVSFFEGVVEQARRGGLVRTELKALVEKTLVLAERGSESAAQATLNDVLILASRHGFVRSVLDAGEPMRALLRDRTVVRKVGEGVREYIKTLLVEFEKDAPADYSSIDLASDVMSGDVATLTQREIEIFKLLNLGLSRQEIAESLCISVNTAKKHLANIYAKLGVSTREEAIKKFYGNPFE